MIIMKKRGAINFVFASLVIFAGSILLYAIMGVIPSEGFNPSDDGVILAQSYRLIQGQVPHLDFVSIRPVGSAVLHMIHFISPLPMEVSARWFTLLQYLTYSLLWAWIIVRFTRIRKYRGLIFFAFLGIWGFVLNQNHYNLFPWTTIDALFWIMLALAFYLPDPKIVFDKHGWWKIGLACAFASMAALSRQTFVLPALVLIGGFIIQGIRLKKWRILLPGLAVGALPAVIYLSVLIMNSSIPLFVEQLTGRTELFETGIRRFYLEFWNSPLIWFFLLVTFLLFVYRITEGSTAGIFFRLSILPIGRVVFGLMFIILGFCVFLYPQNLFGLSFIQFWLLFLLWIFEEVCSQVKPSQRRWFFWIILIAWTSAISLGDNSPVFAIGLINVAGLGYILHQLAERGFSFRRLNQLQGSLVFLLVVIVIISIHVQKKVNYRDVASVDQVEELNSIFDELGRIKTNERTYSYLNEINKFYKVLGFPEGRFVVIPNAPIIYPILGSPNPMPLDWMQGPEFVGSEDRVLEMMKSALKGKEVYFLIDKYDSKQLADTLIPSRLPTKKYPYIESLMNLTKEYRLDSKWFEVRVSK